MTVENYERQLAITSENIQHLDRKLTKYSETDSNSVQLRREFKRLQDRIEHLEKQLVLLDQKITERINTDATDRGWEGKYRRVAAQIDALSREVQSLRETSPSAQLVTSSALLTLSRLRGNLIQGKGCLTELEIMRNFIKEMPILIGHLDALSLYCAKGVPTEMELRQTFPAIARAVIRSNDIIDDVNWWTRVGSVLTNLVSVRPVGPQVLGQSPAALLARTEVFLSAGDLTGALTTIEQLDIMEGVAFQWMEGLAARILAVEEIDKITDVLMAATVEGAAGND